MQFIDLKAQYQCLKEKIDGRIHAVLDHGKYIMGPEVAELEDKLAEFVGVKHAITCANGTDALQLSLMAMGIGQDDAVFCPTFTFFATVEAPAVLGATPIFVDSNEGTFNICIESLERNILDVLECGNLTPKVIIAVDLFGLPANYSEIQRIADKYQLLVIEDAAQGFGGSINGKKAGSFGDIATTSFFPAKPLGCYGDGGAVFTDDDDYAELLRSYRVHGKGTDKYDNVRIGLNSRLDTIQAAILLEKLVVFPQELVNRNRISEAYSEKLSHAFEVPNIPDGYTSSWAQYTLKHDKRTELMSKLTSSSIPSVVYYARNMHRQSAFAGSYQYERNFLIADKLTERVFSLPMHPYLEVQDVDRVCKTLIDLL